jgi:hypothetical protein
MPASADQEPAIYDLYAIVKHLGGASNSGHYITVARMPGTNTWTGYDDAHVGSCAAPKNEQAYILFYKKRPSLQRGTTKIWRSENGRPWFSYGSKLAEGESVTLLPDDVITLRTYLGKRERAQVDRVDGDVLHLKIPATGAISHFRDNAAMHHARTNTPFRLADIGIKHVQGQGGHEDVTTLLLNNRKVANKVWRKGVFIFPDDDDQASASGDGPEGEDEDCPAEQQPEVRCLSHHSVTPVTSLPLPAELERSCPVA